MTHPKNSKRDLSVMNFKVASFFSGAGGLDLGFHNAGFEIVWANEFDKKVTPTLRKNFPRTVVDDRSITLVQPEDLPDDLDGIIGGPPCQSWSEAGAKRGLEDKRGQVFLDYIRLIKAKRPKFFLAENVAGMLSKTHAEAFAFLVKEMESTGYSITFKLLNAADFGVPEDRFRVIFVGYQKSLGEFTFPKPLSSQVTLKDAIWDLRDSATPALSGKRGQQHLAISNHEFLVGGFSSMYMSRNRVRGWDEQSFTIQAGARHAPIHPDAPKMTKIGPDKFEFSGDVAQYRRLSVREAARIQTFPDDFEFLYDDVATGYKMVGNAVAVKFAEALARKIHEDLSKKL
jgi:DNA (cytosine-5)-methyltransferase 1